MAQPAPAQPPQQQLPPGLPPNLQNLTPQQQAQLVAQMQQAQAARQQAANLPKPDPRLQAAIEAAYVPVDIELTEPANSNVRCAPHKLEKCDDCGLDFVDLNRIAKIFVSNPNLRCPPPPNVITKQLSDVINKTKEEGNTLFRTRQHGPAIQRYTQAANFALQRPPWEPSAIVREEVSTIMSNRSASYFEAGEFVAALCDAEIVIQLKKGWSKGYFRKAKALVGLNDLPAAREAIVEGLLFEPDNKDLIGTLTDIDKALEAKSIAAVPAAPTPADA